MPGVDEEAGAHTLAESRAAQSADLLAEGRERERGVGVDAALVADDLGLAVARRVVELERDEALAGRVLQVLQDALVAGVVGDHEQEVGVRLEDLAALVDRQDAAVVGERVDQDDRILTRLDDLVEVADRAASDGLRERAVDPDRLVALDQIAAHEVGAGQILVAGDGDERRRLAAHALHLAVVARAGPEQAVRHVLDEAGLAATGRALQQDRQATGECGGEDVHLVADGEVPRCGFRHGGIFARFAGLRTRPGRVKVDTPAPGDHVAVSAGA